MRSGQIEMGRRALAQIVPDFPAIHLADRAVFVGDGNNQRARQVFVTALPEHAEILQLAPDLSPRLPVFHRQAIAQRPVGITQAERVDQIGMVKTASAQIVQGLRALFQRGVIEGRDAGEHGGVVGVGREGLQFLGGGALDRRGVRRGGMVLAQQLDGMTEGHAFEFLDEADHIAAFTARAQTVPQILVRADHEGRGFVIVEGAASHPVLAPRFQLHTRRLDEPDQAHLILQTRDLRFGYSGHKRLSKAGSGFGLESVKTVIWAF